MSLTRDVVKKDLLILGAGQYGMVAKEIAEAIGKYDRIVFLDDWNPIAIGKLDDFTVTANRFCTAVVAIGKTDLRLDYIHRLEQHGYDVPCLIHPLAYVSPSAIIGKGSFVEPLAVIHTATKVGTGCIISAGAIINHNCCIEDGCHINCGVVVKARTVMTSGSIVE